jgi:steroid delta-isomerase-like uncharacterized protein
MIKDPVMTSITEQLAYGLVDAWNEHNPERVQGYYTPDCEERDVAMAEPQRGSDTIRKIMKYYLRGFPDVVVTLEQLIVDGDQAVIMWNWEGTHKGRFMNIPPTGRRVKVRGATHFTVFNDRVHRVDRVWDVAGLLRGLGLLPEL